MTIEGVPAYQLRCPTCGTLFDSFTVYYERSVEEDAFNVDALVSDIKPVPERWRRFIVCPNNHMWTVKTLWRTANHPDKVLLGEYLGEREWA